MYEQIKLFLFDVDGVLTDGRIIHDANGVESKAFNVADGSGIKWLQRVGITAGIITGRNSPVVDIRAKELGIKIVRQGALRKGEVLEEILQELSLAPEEVAYMGDDLIDLPVMRVVGLTFAPADARPEVLDTATVVTRSRGGEGAAREAVEFLLKASGRWDEIVSRYMS